MDIDARILIIGGIVWILFILYIWLYGKVDDDQADDLISPNEDNEADYLDMMTGEPDEDEEEK